MPTSTGMYPGTYATTNADQPCFIMATSGEVVTYGEFEARTNRLAHLLRDQGLRPPRPLLDLHGEQPALPRDVRGRRALGPVLHGDQLAPHRATSWRTSSTTASRGCSSRRARSSTSSREVVRACARPSSAGSWSTAPHGRGTVRGLPRPPSSGYPDTPIADERLGRGDALLVGHDRPAEGHHSASSPTCRPAEALALMQFLIVQWRYREGMIYLSPAPLYHSAPQACGRPDDPQRRHGDHHGALRSRAVPAARRALRGHPQPARADDVQPDAEAARGRPQSQYDLSSLETVVHAAAPCPVPVKEAMIEWWGPKIIEYYGATEGIGFTTCDSLRVAGPQGHRRRSASSACCTSSTTSSTRCPNGTPGTIWFESPRRPQLLQRPGEDEGGDDAGRQR